MSYLVGGAIELLGQIPLIVGAVPEIEKLNGPLQGFIRHPPGIIVNIKGKQSGELFSLESCNWWE